MRGERDRNEPGGLRTRGAPGGVRRGPRAWLFARLLARADTAQERLYGARKRRLFGTLALPPGAVIVEVGAGAGPNAPFFPRGARWVAVEPNAHFGPHLRGQAERYGLELDHVAAPAERLPLPDASADAAVATLALCSVESPAAVLAEVRRVLRPGAPFVFVEHVAAPRGTVLRALQRALRAPWGLVADGCRPDRETLSAVRAAGFASVEVERFRVPLGLVAPHVAGVAR